MAAGLTYLVTGGAGFIGSAFVHAQVAAGARVVVLDALTYAGHRDNLDPLNDHPALHFVHGDINDAALVTHLLTTHRPDALVHFAAESHVDRSIRDAAPFLRTNILGTQTLLDCTRNHTRPAHFRFINVSTDEVFGALEPGDAPFTEASPYRPNSPYAASKAAADHLARAAAKTYGLPVITTHCSNNYGPRQYPEKLIPLIITNILTNNRLPVYGDGQHSRDWLHVDDHVSALMHLLAHGTPGETYTIGGHAERTTLEVVTALVDLIDRINPSVPTRRDLITHVPDRPGHDRRYAIDDRKLRALGWRPSTSFSAGLAATVAWYLSHPDWVTATRERAQQWLADHYKGLPS